MSASVYSVPNVQKDIYKRIAKAMKVKIILERLYSFLRSNPVSFIWRFKTNFENKAVAANSSAKDRKFLYMSR